MLKDNTSARTRRANVQWRLRNRTAVTIALTPTACARPKFNVIANTLRVHSTRLKRMCAEGAGQELRTFFCARAKTDGIP